MTTYKLTYYTELGFCRRSIKEFSDNFEIATMQADTWLKALGLDLYKIEIYAPTEATR